MLPMAYKPISTGFSTGNSTYPTVNHLDAKQVKLLLADYATVEVSIDTVNKSYEYISFRTMMEILKCL